MKINKKIPGLFTGHGPAHRLDHEVFKTLRVEPGCANFDLKISGRIGSGQKVFKSHGSRSSHLETMRLIHREVIRTVKIPGKYLPSSQWFPITVQNL